MSSIRQTTPTECSAGFCVSAADSALARSLYRRGGDRSSSVQTGLWRSSGAESPALEPDLMEATVGVELAKDLRTCHLTNCMIYRGQQVELAFYRQVQLRKVNADSDLLRVRFGQRRRSARTSPSVRWLVGWLRALRVCRARPWPCPSRGGESFVGRRRRMVQPSPPRILSSHQASLLVPWTTPGIGPGSRSLPPLTQHRGSCCWHSRSRELAPAITYRSVCTDLSPFVNIHFTKPITDRGFLSAAFRIFTSGLIQLYAGETVGTLVRILHQHRRQCPCETRWAFRRPWLWWTTAWSQPSTTPRNSSSSKYSDISRTDFDLHTTS